MKISLSELAEFMREAAFESADMETLAHRVVEQEDELRGLRRASLALEARAERAEIERDELKTAHNSRAAWLARG